MQNKAHDQLPPLAWASPSKGPSWRARIFAGAVALLVGTTVALHSAVLRTHANRAMSRFNLGLDGELRWDLDHVNALPAFNLSAPFEAYRVIHVHSSSETYHSLNEETPRPGNTRRYISTAYSLTSKP